MTENPAKLAFVLERLRYLLMTELWCQHKCVTAICHGDMQRITATTTNVWKFYFVVNQLMEKDRLYYVALCVYSHKICCAIQYVYGKTDVWSPQMEI